MTQQSVLIVDDEPDIRELLEITLNRMGLATASTATLPQAMEAVAEIQPDLCLTDMRLPDGNGLDLVREIARDHPQLPAAVITAHGRVEDAVTALKIGAFDFVSKPVDLSILRKLVNTALKLRSEESEPGGSGAKDDSPFVDDKLDKLTGSSEAIQKCKAMIGKLARSQAPVMISGDSGSGKELAARLIHDLGPRVDEAFVPVNCGAIPTELMESEFFGHLKGSFTGAGTDKEGLFQAADGGTLFLDEVADLPLSMQVKLLRAIQEKAVLPVGARKEVPIDVRILSASHQQLRPLVDEGKFRSDLFFRLNVIELHMPSLSERRDDIEELVHRFIKEIAEQWDEAKAPVISPEAMEALKNHRYTGNVRELINILQRAITMCEGNSITVDDLMLEQISVKESEQSLSDRDDQTLDTYIEDIEKKMLEDALIKTRYNKTRAAELLGISFRSFRYKLKKFDID
jgi:two-component system response regulator PilR (NtrC family)